LNSVFSRSTDLSINDTKIKISSQRVVKFDEMSGAIEYEYKSNRDIRVEIRFGINDSDYSNGESYLKFVECNDKVAPNKHQLVYKTETVKPGRKVVEYLSFSLSSNIVQDDLKVDKGIVSFKQGLKKGVTYKFKKHFKIDVIDVEKSSFSLFINQDKYVDVELSTIKEIYSIYNQSRLQKYYDSINIGIKSSNPSYYQYFNYILYSMFVLTPNKYNSSIPSGGLISSINEVGIRWDTEEKLFPFYLEYNRFAAKLILENRVNSLNKAISNAIKVGHKGCLFKDTYYPKVAIKETENNDNANQPLFILANSIICKAVDKYLQVTKDYDFLVQGGLDLLYQSSLFYYDISSKDEKTGKFNINNIKGIDEFHGNVSNNYLLNVSVKETIEIFLKYNEKNLVFNPNPNIKLVLDALTNFKDNLVIPNKSSKDIIPQFDGYLDLINITKKSYYQKNIDESKVAISDTQLVEVPEVLNVLVGNNSDKELLKKNYDYYLNKILFTNEENYSILGIVNGQLENYESAFDYFVKSVGISLMEKKNTNNTIDDEQINAPSITGGAYMVLKDGILSNKEEVTFIYKKDEITIFKKQR
jgi:trehalose/maltose hydrolase-like predicted phosphorylase